MKTMTLPKILQPFSCSDLIRLGKDNDGGYLVNKEDVLKSTRLLSFGVETDISFEEDFVKLNDCRVDAYDGTIKKSFDFFTAPNRKLHFANIGYNPGNKTISDLLTNDEHNVFLKCDIDGGEYDILNELIIHSDKFSGMVIEFHEINQYSLFNLLSNFIGKTYLKLIHVHANNNSYIESPNEFIPSCIELTFTSSRNIMLTDIFLPHKLDMPNTPLRDELPIVF